MFKIYLTVPYWKGFFLPHLLLSIKFSVISKVKKFLLYKSPAALLILKLRLHSFKA